ncbi:MULTISPECIES: serine/threonine-protein kinase [Mycobacteriaceae]|uniref:Serine/threonine protein kinase n=1 Tax=Mycolicibacterium parafortuitum TaxID=39692 RepID=A0ACC6MB29_MYCPF|nr:MULTISPECIES: serine/threonine-protein kinase [Mycobacteriaceae]MBX7452745.1 serine/threonine protein kinase [Mycolicibacterium aurantiacum]MDZ5084143.1 serine/threonine protein kinase [Mycolicibacterium parafortuitum]GFM16833.1 serine/threonine protein kinase [Mycobacterium sp. PO1]GFM24086.1 serine/threonine protein kinase [Mycobacterium sp. PO2]
MPLTDGEVIAGYTISRRLGAGGMGEVYLAKHPRLPRYDALKVLSAAVTADDEYRQRFNREADIAATLWHPHIVAVHDRGEFGGRLWISMDHVEGTDAAALLAQRYPDGMPPELVARIVSAVGDALDYAHERGLLHRDVKPANILIADPQTDHERIMLADFGIARRVGEASSLTATNMTVGTVAYSAPEQLTADKHIDGRADQYALAATAFQLLTGTPPFQHSNPAIVISQHLTAQPPAIEDHRPELSGLSGAFRKALAKSPADRFDTCADFARALANRTRAAVPGGSFTDTDDDEATMLAPAAAGGRHAKKSSATPSRGRLLILTALALSLIAVVSVLLLVFYDRGERRADAGSATPSASPTQPAPGAGVTLPVVVVGADCATLGAAGLTEQGAPAYCARLSSTGAPLWSLYPGEIAHPSGAPTAGPAADTDTPVLVCMQQTGRDEVECRKDILAENTDPSANDNQSG